MTQRVVILCHRKPQFSADAFILTVELTLAAPLIREMAAGCAAKRNTGMRAKGILTTGWWNRRKKFDHLCFIDWGYYSTYLSYVFCVWIYKNYIPTSFCSISFKCFDDFIQSQYHFTGFNCAKQLNIICQCAIMILSQIPNPVEVENTNGTTGSLASIGCERV